MLVTPTSMSGANVASFGAAAPPSLPLGGSTFPAIDTAGSTPPAAVAPTTDFGAATSLSALETGMVDFTIPSIFDTTGDMGAGGNGQIFGVNMTDMMAIDAGLAESFANAFALQAPLVTDDMLFNLPTPGQMPYGSDGMNGGNYIYSPGNMQPAATMAPATAPPPAQPTSLPLPLSDSSLPPISTGGYGQLSVSDYANAMNQIAGYNQAIGQIGMDTSLYAAQMAAQTAGVQAQGQMAMDYMNMLA